MQYRMATPITQKISLFQNWLWWGLLKLKIEKVIFDEKGFKLHCFSWIFHEKIRIGSVLCRHLIFQNDTSFQENHKNNNFDLVTYFVPFRKKNFFTQMVRVYFVRFCLSVLRVVNEFSKISESVLFVRNQAFKY